MKELPKPKKGRMTNYGRRGLGCAGNRSTVYAALTSESECVGKI